MLLDCRRVWFAVFLFFLSIGYLSAQEEQEETIVDEIVAKVNQEVITLTDLKSELRVLQISLTDEIPDQARRDEVFEERKKGLLKNLIQNKLMIQQAEEFGLTADADVEIEAALEQQREQLGIPNMEVFDQALQQRGTNLQEYRENMKSRMIMNWLIQQQVYSKITLLTPEIEAYYQQHLDEFKEAAEVGLAEILFLKEGKDPAAVRTRDEEALKKLQEGTSFAELTAEYSDGATASQGGNIGKFKQGSLDPKVEEVAFSLLAGQTSGIIESGYGFQILKVVSKVEDAVKPLEEVRGRIQDALYQQKAEPELKAFMEGLVEQSFVYVSDKYRAEYNVEGM
jgi:peptidyl-prolyl cis-trans isomerase SurA